MTEVMQLQTLTLLLVLCLFIHQLRFKWRFKKTMSDFRTQFNEYREAVRKETDRLASVFAKLIAKADEPTGLSPEEWADVMSTVKQLQQIGVSPEQPIPAAPATPAADILPEPSIETLQAKAEGGAPADEFSPGTIDQP